MKILICIATMEGGGAERQVVYLTEGFIKKGHDVHVVLIRGGVNFESLLSCNATIHMLGYYGKLRLIVSVFKIFNSIKPEILYLWQRPFDIIGGVIGLILNLNTFHAERTDPTKIKSGFKKWAANLIIPYSKGVISNSESGALYWKTRKRKLEVNKISNVIPFDRIYKTESSTIIKDYFIFVGRLDKNKNVTTAISAIKYLKNLGFKINLMIVGEGPEFTNLLEICQREGLSKQIKFIGYRTDVWNLMKGSNGLISLSRFEGEPNTVLEAVALGCNLILSNIPSHKPFSGIDNVFFVDPDDEIETAKAIIELKKNKSQSKDKNQSKITLYSQHNVENVIESHIRIFEKHIN